MGIPFLNLLSESIFDFWKWSNWKYAITGICVFSVWPLQDVKKLFQKQIWKENAYISIQKILKSFGQYSKSQKMDFPLYFQKVISPA